ncbi:helix-turn-helix transcriptional regulator [Mycolicibacterium baixiangningiae]|uniref:helix-turn-helix transcriptional regulator n=1 Tax=Mycolicibacterium baixiangningiae TaxID=2761578 RepID=UPI0018D1D8A5|nr:helix-turn-helix domain-containing protein [Mycolicibacterium baixiangningiae]
MSTPAPDSVTTVWLAQQLGVSPKTVLRRIHDGTIPAIRVGPRGIRIRCADAYAVIEQMAVHPDRMPAPLDGAK